MKKLNRSNIINRVKTGKINKSEAARILGVSRKTVYKWINNKKKNIDFEKYILRIVIASPKSGPQKISNILKKQGYRLSTRSVWLILKRLNLNNAINRENYIQKYRIPRQAKNKEFPTHLRLNANTRKQMVEEVLSGSKEIDVLNSYKVSRKTFAKWKKRYIKAKNESVNLLEVLKDQHPEGSNHPRGVNETTVNKVLNIVASNPEYSSHKIALLLGYIGNHGVQRILERNSLSYYELRQAYSQREKVKPEGVFARISNFVKVLWQEFIPNLAPAPPPGEKIKAFRIVRTFAITSFVNLFVSLGLFYWIRLLNTAGTTSNLLGLIFASIAFLMGSLFFLYSFKYYLTLAIVLSFSQQEASLSVNGNGNGKRKGLISWILGMTGGNGNGNGKNHVGPVGLEPNLDHVKLDRHPYFSTQIPFYNEKNVVERAIAAATNFDYKGDYEVILCDDSTDETTQIIRNTQKRYLVKGEELKEVNGNGWTLTAVEVSPGVILKHLHRSSRSGFKGGALKLALKLVNPRTEFISVFDADFVPYPDTLELFLKYFEVQNNMSEDYKKSNVAAVCGYQWHVLNKSENWITRGVRTEYSGSYVIERSGTEIYGGMKLIHGSVYAIRRDALEAVGWDTSITEDFELTLKLYNKGYKVVYTPYIQAPAECVSTLRRLIRQRMRWSEGHSHNIKKMFVKLLIGEKKEIGGKKEFIPSPLTFTEKLEFLYLSPYYLQAFFFLIGTFSWLLSETVFPARLPFWTSLWGWSLVLTNLFALPLMNTVGLFLEESEEKDYLGLGSFIALSYLLVPFQAYASIKGFLEKEEGTWFRTPKTGRITDVFTRGRFYRFISGILPGRTPSIAPNQLSLATKYLALSTANNQFNSFNILPRRNKWISKLTLTILLILSVTTYSATKGVPEVLANPAISSTQYLNTGTTTTLSNSRVLGESVDTGNTVTATVVAIKLSTLQRYEYRPGGSGLYPEPTCVDGAATGYGWILDVPFQENGTINSGTWSFTFYESDSPNAQAVGNLHVCVYKITVSSGSITGSTLLFDTGSDAGWPITDIIGNDVTNTTYTTSNMNSFTLTTNEYLFVQYSFNLTGTSKDTTTIFTGGATAGTDPKVVIPTVTVPENVIYLILVSTF